MPTLAENLPRYGLVQVLCFIFLFYILNRNTSEHCTQLQQHIELFGWGFAFHCLALLQRSLETADGCRALHGAHPAHIWSSREEALLAHRADSPLKGKSLSSSSFTKRFKFIRKQEMTTCGPCLCSVAGDGWMVLLPITAALIPVTAITWNPLGLCALNLLFCVFPLVPYIPFSIKNWRRFLVYAKYQNPKSSLSALFVHGKKNRVKWIQCFHNTSILCTRLFAYSLARNSLHGQWRSSQNNVCCSQKCRGTQIGAFLCQHQATGFPSIELQVPRWPPPKTQLELKSHRGLHQTSQLEAQPGDRELQILENKWNFWCLSSRTSPLSLPLSPFPTPSSLQVQLENSNGCNNASVRSSKVFGDQVLAAFYSSYCLLRTSKMCIYLGNCSQMKHFFKAGVLFLFIYIYSGNLFLSWILVCCNPHTKTAR